MFHNLRSNTVKSVPVNILYICKQNIPPTFILCIKNQYLIQTLYNSYKKFD